MRRSGCLRVANFNCYKEWMLFKLSRVLFRDQKLFKIRKGYPESNSQQIDEQIWHRGRFHEYIGILICLEKV